MNLDRTIQRTVGDQKLFPQRRFLLPTICFLASCWLNGCFVNTDDDCWMSSADEPMSGISRVVLGGSRRNSPADDVFLDVFLEHYSHFGFQRRLLFSKGIIHAVNLRNGHTMSLRRRCETILPNSGGHLFFSEISRISPSSLKHNSQYNARQVTNWVISWCLERMFTTLDCRIQDVLTSSLKHFQSTLQKLQSLR